MPGRSGFLALLLLLTAALVTPGRTAETDQPAPAPAAPAKPAAARPATKPPAKPAAKHTTAKTPAPAAAPAAPMTPEEATRQAYKARLAEDLARVQATLQKQQVDLASEQNKLKSLYSEMMEAVSKSDSDPAASAGAGGPPGPGGAGGGPNAKKEMSPAVKASVSYEAQTYKVQVARQAVLSSEKEVVKLQGFIQRMSQ